MSLKRKTTEETLEVDHQIQFQELTAIYNNMQICIYVPCEFLLYISV